MKKVITSGILIKLLVLGILICGLIFVATSDKNMQIVKAAPCCISCPGFEDNDPSPYCENYCGADSGPCYDRCVQSVFSCYSSCVSCSGGGGSWYYTCQFDTQCPPGSYCTNGRCNQQNQSTVIILRTVYKILTGASTIVMIAVQVL